VHCRGLGLAEMNVSLSENIQRHCSVSLTLLVLVYYNLTISDQCESCCQRCREEQMYSANQCSRCQKADITDSTKISVIIIKTIRITEAHHHASSMELTAEDHNKSVTSPANYQYPGRDHETWFELSKFSSYPRSS